MTATTEELPPRPRRKLVTPITTGLAAVLLLAGGFIGGVEVQKAQGDAGSGGPSAASFGAQRGGPQQESGGGGGAANATIGTVKSKKGSTLYVSGADGTTVKVKTNSNSKVTRTASSSAGGVHPGDTVIVQGKAGGDGVVTASQIVATSSSATTGGGLLGGGGFFRGGGGGGRGGPPQQGGGPQFGG